MIVDIDKQTVDNALAIGRLILEIITIITIIYMAKQFNKAAKADDLSGIAKHGIRLIAQLLIFMACFT